MSNVFAQMMGGGGGAPGAGPDPSPQEGQGEQDSSAAVGSAIDAIHAAIKASDDPQDKLILTKALALVQGIHASEAKEQDAALGTTPAHKGMAKQIQSIAAQVHGGSGGGY